MKQLNEFTDLATAQGYYYNTGKMISPDMMLAFLTNFGHIGILDNPTEDEAKALMHAFSFGSEFNLMKLENDVDYHPASIIDLLNSMVTKNLVTQNFADALIAYANTKTYPYKDVTQTELDLALGTMNPTIVVSKYHTLDNNADYIVNKFDKKLLVTVTIAPGQEVALDDVITFKAQSKTSTMTDFAQSAMVRGSISIPANTTGTFSAPISNINLHALTKVIAFSKYDRPAFTVLTDYSVK